MSELQSDDDGTLPPLPQFAWCRDCWSPAHDDTREELGDVLPDECHECGSSGVFWI